jgi:hypothetical protein
MRLGHSVNSDIPDDVNQAEFPPEPWPERVTIRIKSQAPPQYPVAPLPVGGDSPLPASSLPLGWRGDPLGQAQPISAGASGLVGYESQNQGTENLQVEEPEDPELLRVRGVAMIDEEVHKQISWTTRKNYELWIGVSLPIKDPVGEFSHEGQLWEEGPRDPVIEEHHAAVVYNWLCERLAERSFTKDMLPPEMPFHVEEVTVQTWRDGKAGYIMFTPWDSTADPMKDMDVQVMVEYEGGHMKVGMGNAYTIKMLGDEFQKLTQRDWRIYPLNGHRRLTDTTVVHQSTRDQALYELAWRDHEVIVQPPKILEERGRGTIIVSPEDQGKPLQYWAWIRQKVEIGVLIAEEKLKTEYWMDIELQPVPGDENPMTYLMVLKQVWTERLLKISPGMARKVESLGEEFNVQFRYIFNGLRIWFVPTHSHAIGLRRSLAEESCPRDKWYSNTDLMAFTYPTLPDDQIREMPRILFGPNHSLQERYDDPEVQGGKIALIAFKQMRAQKPPNCLDRTHSRFLKQVAYNERVIGIEKEIAAINADAVDFFHKMTLNHEDQIFVCVNGSEEMKRGEEPIAGQLWTHQDRHLTVCNRSFEGMADTRESAILTRVAEAVTWRHALELEDDIRRGQRIIIHPKEMTKLTEVLREQNPSLDQEDGHQLAYTVILQSASAYEHPPVFVPEDHEQLQSDPEIARRVAEWMNTAAKVATGNRRRVLEDGRDVMRSDEEDAISPKDAEPDEEHGMYAPGCTSLDQAKMTEEQAQAQSAEPLNRV